ncbi:ATP-binding protein [Catenulispora yoronensis]|uniref:histidine kinase n=2 Tax=Catenulispora yoronensis TaxID=450799 RepID=A0ABN2U6J3_9ACTN
MVSSVFFLPRPTVRLRLTLLYGLCFVASGTALLGITYALVNTRLSRLQVSTGSSPDSASTEHAHATTSAADSLHAQRTADLHQLVVQSGIALAIMAVVSVGLGWLLAGRTLRPLREITSATRTISEHNLHDRLAHTGPDDELKDLAGTIDALLARLESAFDSQKRFVANASHELRTPIMLGKTLLQVALADPDLTLPALRAACHEVLVTADDQEHLIQALLTLARSQAGLDHREPFDLAKVTQGVVDAHHEEIGRRGLRLDTALERAPMDGDPQLMEVLVTNLLENAIRHNVVGGSIRIATGDAAAVGSAGPAADIHAARPVLAVSNTGDFIPTAEVQRILQPFQHLARPRGHNHEGLGLGLSIVAAIADAHTAALSLQAPPTGGLAVHVGLRKEARGS